MVTGCGPKCHVAGREISLNLITVEPVIFLYMFSSNLQFPALQALIYKKSCLENFNTSFCDDMDNKTFQKLHKDEQDINQSDASYWIMLNNVGLTLPSIFVVFFFIGSWGDKVNRKVPVLLPCVGALLSNLSHLLNSYFMDWPLDLLMIGPVLNGLFGGYITMLMGVYSYITHIAEPQEKTIRVGIVESMVFLAGTISVFISGLLLKAVGYVWVFAILAICTAAAILYSLTLLNSVVPEATDHRESCCKFWFLDSLRDTLMCVKRVRPDKTKLTLILQLIILNILQLCTTGEGDILFLFLKRSPRSFTSTQYGYFKGTENFTRCFALITILPVLKHIVKVRDTTVVMLGIVSKAAGLILLGLADTLTLVFIVVIFAMFQGFPAAALRASMSSLVDKDEQGRLFSVVAASESCVTLATTFIFNGWYPKTLSTFDGTCFEFAAGMCGLALIIAICLHVMMRPDQGKFDMEKETPSPGQDRYASISDVTQQVQSSNADTKA